MSLEIYRPYAVSDSSNGFGTTSTSWTDVTNSLTGIALTTTIKTTGRPVWIGLIPEGGGERSAIESSGLSSNLNLTFWMRILRDGTSVAEYAFNLHAQHHANDFLVAFSAPPSNVMMIDTPAAGTYTYKIQLQLNGTGYTANVTNSKLAAFELG